MSASIMRHMARSAIVAARPVSVSARSLVGFTPIRSLQPHSFMAAAPCRTIRTVAARMGGAVDDDDDGYDEHGHFHGHDFLDRANVERRVRMVLSEIEKVDKTKLNDLTSSWQSLGLDSLDEVEVVMLLEDEFVIDIQDEVASNILSIQDAINYIINHPFAANDEH